MLWEQLLVFVLIAGAAGYLTRSFWRMWTGQSSGCGGCGGCGNSKL